MKRTLVVRSKLLYKFIDRFILKYKFIRYIGKVKFSDESFLSDWEFPWIEVSVPQRIGEYTVRHTLLSIHQVKQFSRFAK